MTERLQSNLVSNGFALIFFSLFLLLPSQLGKHFWPSSAFVLGERVDYLSPTLYATDIIIALLLFFQVLQGKLGVSKKIILPLLPILISVLISANFYGSLYASIKLVEFTLLFFAIVNYPKNINKLICVALAIGITGESILSIAQYFQQGSIGGVAYFFGERTFSGTTPGIANAVINNHLVMRPYGTFPHPNVLAGYLLLGMFLLAEYMNTFKNKFGKLILKMAICVGSFALFLTLSRVAILLWFVFIVLFFTIRIFPKKKLTAVAIFIVLVLGIITILSYAGLIGRFVGFSLMDETIIERQTLAQASLSMWRDHFLFGVGLGNFLRLLPLYESAQTLPFVLQPVHNIFLLIGTETGISGLLVFAWFVGTEIKKIVTNKAKYLFLACSFLAILIIGFFDHYFLTLQQGQLLFTVVAALVYKEMQN